MTDVHCHVTGGDPRVREFLIGRDFFGHHPWEALSSVTSPVSSLASSLSCVLAANPSAGVGEIGLDRLKTKATTPEMRELFEAQLAVAAEFGRPVVLHGAKCWGEVVRACGPVADRIPAFLFHGFSRSDGLLPDIVSLNGFVSVGPAVLNDHAVNYRALVKKIPAERLLLETDRTEESAATCPSVAAVAAKVAELRGLTVAELEALTDANADRFLRRG